MNFEFLLLIFVAILIGVIAFDHKKKKVVLQRTNHDKARDDFKTNNNQNINSKVQKGKTNVSGEFVSKPRVISNDNNEMDFIEQAAEPLKTSHPEKIIYFYVKAKKNQSFLGNDLLRVLLSLGCRFGDMKIFHRHEHKNGIGRELFSVASMLEPGSFDLNRLPEAKIPGVVLFFSTAKVNNPLETYHLMLDAAKKLTQYLDGELLNEKRESLAPESVTEMSELLASYTNSVVDNV